MTVPIGPFFPVLEEPVFLKVFADGEEVVGLDYRGFFSHRGIEKLGDSKLTYNEMPFVAERICGICGFVHSTAYVQALENAVGVEAPLRARYIRSIVLELERIHSHLLWLGIAGPHPRLRHRADADLADARAGDVADGEDHRQPQVVRDEPGRAACGGTSRRRSTPEIVRVLERDREGVAEGGRGRARGHAAADAPVEGRRPQHARRARAGLGRADRARLEPRRSTCASTIRTRPTTGSRSAASGRSSCDAAGRTLVRLEETLESIRQVKQLLAEMPDGPIHARRSTRRCRRGARGSPPSRRRRGEVIHYVMTGEDARPYRWRVRAPTYANLQALAASLQGMSIADVPITLGSMDPCFSCTERMQVRRRPVGRRPRLQPGRAEAQMARGAAPAGEGPAMNEGPRRRRSGRSPTWRWCCSPRRCSRA